MGSNSTKPHCYPYPRPALTADVAIVTLESEPRVLLIRRRGEPFALSWALPGGFVNEGESLAAAAARELTEETGVSDIDLIQIGAFGDPGRDPRGWTVTVVYLARVPADGVHAVAADDASEVKWFSLKTLPEMAFDHAMILDQIRSKHLESPLADR